MKNKKGISLIVLVITIIVIIILAAAVILTLTDNNPISNAKVASLAQNKDSLESAINLYTAQVVAKTQGTWTNSEILRGNVDPVASTDTILAAGTASMPIIVKTPAEVTANVNGITVYQLDETNLANRAKINLPTPPSGSSWYVDPASNKVYVVFPSTATVPTWMDLTNDATVKAFVVKLS